MGRIRQLERRLKVVEARVRQALQERHRAAHEILVEALIRTLGLDELEALLKTARPGQSLQLPLDRQTRFEEYVDQIAMSRYGATYAELQQRARREFTTVSTKELLTCLQNRK
jgi:hypothetical protein